MNLDDLKVALQRFDQPRYDMLPEVFGQLLPRPSTGNLNPDGTHSYTFVVPPSSRPMIEPKHDDQIDALHYGMRIVSSPFVPPDKAFIIDEHVRERVSRALCETSLAFEDAALRFGDITAAFHSIGHDLVAGVARGIRTGRTRPPRRLARRAHAKRVAKRAHH